MFRDSRRAALTVCWSALAFAGTAGQAHAVGNAFNPVTTPPVFPGTSTQVDAWKLTGGGLTTDSKGRASQVQVAPRWVISSGHADLQAGMTFVSPAGATSKVLWSAYPRELVAQGSDDDRAADVSVSLLETAIPAPAGGFPLLLSEDVGSEVAKQLPGAVLWSGQGGTPDTDGVPTVQWAKPAGAPITGSTPFEHIGNDSGSAGFLYRNATARPIVAGVVTNAGTAKPFGADQRYGAPIPDTTVGSFATIGAWIRDRIATKPEATPPTWTTFAQAGIDLTTFKPFAPTDFKAKSATPTSVTFSWAHHPDTRVPRTAYKVQFGGTTISMPANTTSYTRTGLTTGTPYTFTVRAVNANGESVPDASTTVTFTPRPDPTAVSGLVVEGIRASGSQKPESNGPSSGVTYCAIAKWSAATITGGYTINRYETLVDGTLVTPAGDQYDTDTTRLGADGLYHSARCGLAPGSQVTVGVRAVSSKNAGPIKTKSVTLPSGAPLGTPFEAPRNFTLTARRGVNNGSLDYCITAKWTAPLPVDGFPVVKYSALVTAGGAYAGANDDIPAGATSVDICGLRADRIHRLSLYADYGVASPEVNSTVRTPTGAPNGTPIDGPSGTSLSTYAASKTGGVDYCVTVRWTAPTPPAGVVVDSFDVKVIAGDGSVPASALGVWPQSTAQAVDLCGLKANTSYSVLLTTRFTSDGTQLAVFGTGVGSVTTINGAPSGTLWPAPTITSLTQTTVNGQACLTVAWNAPPAITGFAPTEYSVALWNPTFTNGSDPLPPSARSTRICGLPASGRTVRVTLTATYSGGGVLTSAVQNYKVVDA